MFPRGFLAGVASYADNTLFTRSGRTISVSCFTDVATVSPNDRSTAKLVCELSQRITQSMVCLSMKKGRSSMV